MTSFKVADLARAIKHNIQFKEVGVREGEKIHEDMIIEADAPRTREFERYYVTYPYWERKLKGRRVAEDFTYSSANGEWTTTKELL